MFAFAIFEASTLGANRFLRFASLSHLFGTLLISLLFAQALLHEAFLTFEMGCD